MNTPDQEGTARFRPRARMIKILGAQLIRDNTVGLMELVKNGYDADAQLVRVELHHTRQPERTTIIVQDNGYGMTEEVIRGPWFEPAHGGKERQKVEGRRTALDRLPLGEKGVGRFATEKLGQQLELVSRAAGEQIEFVVTIDWQAFEQEDLYIDEIAIPIISRTPEVFPGDTHGTRLTMRNSPEPWKQRDIQRFRDSLIRLLSPHKGVEHFTVELLCPEYPELQNLDDHDIWERYQFRLDAAIDEKGIALIEYFQRKPNGSKEFHSEEQNLWTLIHPDEGHTRNPACGPMFIQLSAWMLETASLQQYGLNRDQLRTLGGVSIYRDGFRILPYGDEGDDWLGLDQRRVNVPAKRFGNRQLLGIVEIDQVANTALMDKTNREGLQENQAYQDLREIVLMVIQSLEQHSLEQRKSGKKQPASKQEMQKTIKDLREEIQHLRDNPPVTAPSQQDTPVTETPSPAEQAEGAATRYSIEEVVQVPKAKLDELEERTEQLSEAFNGRFEPEDEETFWHLLGIGLAAERFAHEFDRQVSNAMKNLQELKTGTPGNREQLAQLDVFINVLRNELRRMGILRYVRRSQQSHYHSVRHVIELVLEMSSETLQNAQIQVEKRLDEDFDVYISEASLAQVIDNIIDNAIFWLKQKIETRQRRLRIEIVAHEKAILLSNNGPAILPNIRHNLFERRFTTAKPEGRGLGMYIAAEILQRNGGHIDIVGAEDSRVLLGAAFSITFYDAANK